MSRRNTGWLLPSGDFRMMPDAFSEAMEPYSCSPLFSVRKRTPPRNPARSRSKLRLSFDKDSGRIDLRFEVPLGESGRPYLYLARLRMRAAADLRDVARVGTWFRGSLR